MLAFIAVQHKVTYVELTTSAGSEMGREFDINVRPGWENEFDINNRERWSRNMVEEFRKYLEDHAMSENTIRSYLIVARGFLRWYEESFGAEMGRMFRPNFLDYKSYLETVKRLSAESINAKVAGLACFNRFLIESGRQEQMVIDSRTDYLPVQTAYASPSVVGQQEVDAFRQAVLASGKIFCERDYAIMTLLAYAGLRNSEMVNLLLADSDLVSREIVVRKGKGNKKRIVYIGDKIVNALKEYLKIRKDQRYADSPYLFISRQSPKLHRSRIDQICAQYSEVITPHMLRHFYCSHSLETGEYSIAEVANQAGHANVRTTLRYTNPSIREMKEKANKL